MEDGSSWTQNIYTCATATKATIKTVVTTYTVAISTTVKGTSSDTSRGVDYTMRASLAMWAR
jgi:hypothetical protein